MRFTGHGHPAIRATHEKTLELAVDTDITGRATCVVAVGVRPEPPRALAGRVRITIAAAGESFALEADANSSWDPSGTAVIRRSPLRLPGTFATNASAASSELPRALVEALRTPQATVQVTVEPVHETEPTVVLCALGQHPAPYLTAEQGAADAVVCEDAAARRLVEPRGDPGLARRVLVVATADLPGRSVLDRLASSAVETAGLPARLAAAAAAPRRGPLVLAPDDADPRTLLRLTPAGHRLVLRTMPVRLPALLALAGDLRGEVMAVLAQEYAPPIRVTADTVPGLARDEPVYCCLFSSGDDELDPAVRAAITGLLADGVPTKTAAKALAELTGWSRGRAYDAVLQWPT